MMRIGRLGTSLASAAVIWLAGCGGDGATAPGSNPLAEEIRGLATGRKISPLRHPPPVRPELVRLGQALAFDKILSGNRDIACMTCHLPRFATGDARSLSVGQGASGLGPTRRHPGGIFIPRNAPPLFNLFALNSLFLDGRVSVDERGQYRTPAGDQLTPDLTRALEFGAAAAVGFFPVLSRSEMRGDSDNELALIDDKAPSQVWQALMARLGRVEEYRRMFEAAYPGQRFESMNFGHATNAIAGFFIDRLSFANSPWDRLLGGDDEALGATQLAGAKNFLKARCSICHNGPALTDNQFHNVAVAQIGPGKGDGPAKNDDFGRMQVTGLAADKYAFRTPALRNVELTAPYGHDGVHVDLRAFVDHYSESDIKLRTFDAGKLEPALGPTLLRNLDEILATRDTLLRGVVFADSTIDQVTEFMKALTDPAARNLQRIVPARVPSGLPVDGD